VKFSVDDAIKELGRFFQKGKRPNYLLCKASWRLTALSNLVCKKQLFVLFWKSAIAKGLKAHLKKLWSEYANKLYRLSDRRLLAKWLPTFADKGCHVVSVTSLWPYSWFSRQKPLLFYQVAPRLYSRGWVDPVPNPLLFFFGSAGNRTRAFGSVLPLLNKSLVIKQNS
jgi:hypothetical protein